MWDKIKGWLGIHGPAIILSLEERHVKAQELAEDAFGLFDRIVADVDDAVAELNALAQEAADKAADLLAKGEAAATEAAKHAVRAAKIRELLG